MSNKAAIRYAKAILQNANEGDNATIIFGDMQSISKTLEGSKELRNFLKSPIIKVSDKKEALLSVFSKQSELSKQLINVLSENQRINLLGDVAESFISVYNEQKGIKVAKVTTAVALSRELESQILTKVKELTGSENVTLETTIDPSIIGGFILRVGDLQYNASIADKLNKIKREFSLN